MRKATNIERILCDVFDLCMNVANEKEKIISVMIDCDDDLIVRTMDGKSIFDWEIGFGNEKETDDECKQKFVKT